jgi:hypothetical protein
MPNRLTLIVSILKAGPEQFVGPSDDPDEGLQFYNITFNITL